MKLFIKKVMRKKNKNFDGLLFDIKLNFIYRNFIALTVTFKLYKKFQKIKIHI